MNNQSAFNTHTAAFQDQNQQQDLNSGSPFNNHFAAQQNSGLKFNNMNEPDINNENNFGSGGRPFEQNGFQSQNANGGWGFQPSAFSGNLN